jgi:hypothetical protein
MKNIREDRIKLRVRNIVSQLSDKNFNENENKTLRKNFIVCK